MEEVTNVLEAIKAAIQMEKDGYSFYKKAAAQTSNEMGQSVFESLAGDELVHLDVFEKIFNETLGEKQWHDLVDSNKKYESINLFPKDLKEKEGANPDIDELDALRMAMESEQTAIDFYSKILQATSETDIKKVIKIIIEQEKQHYSILEGEFSHLSSTGYWYELDYLGG